MPRISESLPLLAAGLILSLGLLPAGFVGVTMPWLMLIVAPVVLLAPGLLLVRAFNLRETLDLEAIALAVGFSIAACVLIGLALHILGRLDRSGWAIVYAGLIYLLLRREQPLLTRRRVLRVVARAGAYRPGARGLMLAAAALFTLASLAIARNGAEAHRQFAFTELWSLPARPQDMSLIEVGVRNMEKQPQGYILDALVNGLVVSRREIPELAHGEVWHDLVPVPAPFAITDDGSAPGPSRVELHLYRAGEEQVVYRKAILSLPEPVDPLAAAFAAAPDEPRTPRRRQPATNQHQPRPDTANAAL